MKTSILLDHEPVADGGYLLRSLLRIEGQAPPDDGRTPLNLSLVLDRSGSMSGPPLHAAIQAAQMLVRRLRPEDVVSVVAYDDRVAVVTPPSTGEDQDHLVEHLGNIAPGGTTNLSGGWLRGRDLVAENRTDGGVNRILLLTDGLANQGITEPDRLVGLARGAGADGISTTTLGFGPRFDEDLLRAMADAGGGSAYYIEEVDQATGVFEEELEGLLSIAAQNLRVSVRPGADAEFVQVRHHYPSHADGDVLTLEVGDLYAREPRRVLMEFLLGPGSEEGAEVQVADVTLEAHVVTEDGGVELQRIDLPITVSPVDGGQVHPEVRREALLLDAADAREKALDARERGDLAGGAEALRDAIERLEANPEAGDAVREELEELRALEAAYRRRELREEDVKYAKQRVYDTSRSRDSSKQRIRRGGGS